MAASKEVSQSIRQTVMKAGVLVAGIVAGFGLMGLSGATSVSAGSFCAQDLCDIECEWSPEGTTCSSDTCEHKEFTTSYCDFQPDGSCVIEECVLH